jgi:hypothetical protein
VRLLTRNLAYHRRANIEARLDLVLYELERQIEELRAERGLLVGKLLWQFVHKKLRKPIR